jgi:hypothetical protein
MRRLPFAPRNTGNFLDSGLGSALTGATILHGNEALLRCHRPDLIHRPSFGTALMGASPHVAT